MKTKRNLRALPLLVALCGVGASCANGGNEGGDDLVDPNQPQIGSPQTFPEATPGDGVAGSGGVAMGPANGGQSGASDPSSAGAPPADAGPPGMMPPPMPGCTEGASCGARTCGDYGACSYSETCAQGGTRSRACNDWVCKSGMCAAVPATEQSGDGCGRITNGASCGSTGCTGSCDDWSSSCDTERDKHSSCYSNTCSNGACIHNTWTTDAVCETRSVACQPGAMNPCQIDQGNGCVCNGHQTCTSSCTWSVCAKLPGNCLC